MSARVSFADLLKAGANKDKQRLNLKLAAPTPPTLKSIAPEKDFTRVANSIVREAVPDGLFIGKSKQIYDYLYSITRGAIQPKRTIRATKTSIMKNADIGSERTLLKNLRHLKLLGLIKITEFEGQREGSEYETFLPEEIQPNEGTHPTPPHPRYPLQKVGTLPSPQSGVGGVGQTIESKTTCSLPKTSLKDFKENDDEPAARGASLYARGTAREGLLENLIDTISKKTNGKILESSDRKSLEELVELLAMEFEIAITRTNSISNVPAFLLEHLRRRLLKKSDNQPLNKDSRVKISKNPSQPNSTEQTEQTNFEIYQAEPLTVTAKETVLQTIRDYIKKGQRKFVLSLEDTYTKEDWKWLMQKLSDMT